MFSDWAKFAGFSAFLAVALAIGILALQETPKTAQEHQRTGRHENHSDAAANWSPWLVVFKTLNSGGMEEITEYCNSHTESEKKNWPQFYYCELKVTDVWLVIFTGVLAIATALLTWATYSLWRATVSNERPWVGPITVNCDVRQGTVVIKNTGRSPALRMRVSHRALIVNPGQAPMVLNIWEVPKALFPGAEDFYHPTIEGGPLSQADFGRMAAGTRELWVIARIEYFDGDGNFYHTDISTRWGGVNRPVMVPHGNNSAS